MKVWLEVFRWLLICETATACVVPRGYCQIEARATDTAKVLVWVRDGRGAPVSGLTADDFVATENGVRDRVVAVANFSGAASKQFSAGRASIALGGPAESADLGTGVIERRSSAGTCHARTAHPVRLPVQPRNFWALILPHKKALNARRVQGC